MSTSLLERIAAFARVRPEETALAFVARGEPDVEISWRDLETTIRRLGRHLEESGVSPGEVVLVLSASPREQALGFLGALACGAVPTILSFPSVKQSEERFLENLGAVAESGRARWALASEELAPAIERWGRPGVGRLRFPEPPPRRPRPDPLPSPPFPPGEGAPSLFIQFSSGTTGARKGVAVTAAMFAAQAESCSAALGLGPADRVVSWLPLYHDNGLVGCFLLPLYRGAASIHLTPFEWVEEPVSLFRAVDRYQGTLLWSPSFAFSFCARRIAPEDLSGLRLGSLRALISGGELTRESSFRRFLDRFGPLGISERHLQVTYGMAENTFVLTQTPLGLPVRKDVVDRRAFFEEGRAVPTEPGSGMTFYSCGPVLPGQRMRIAGATGDRQVGEIEVRSEGLFAGYLTPEGLSTEGVFAPDGWYRSGDQGYLAEGELFCTGRLRDLVICRGVNLHPEDLEEAVARVPGVKEGRVAAFGVADEEEGTEGIVVLLEPEGEPAAGIERRVREEVASSFGLDLKDVQVRGLGTLLKSTSGKISRKANRNLYLEALAQEAAPRGGLRVEPRDPWEAELVEIWRRVLGVPSLGVTDDLFLDLGASSLSALSAVGEIRARLGREVEAHELLGRETVERQAQLLRERGSAGSGALVPLRSGGESVPLFLVHPAGGSPWSYLGLARRLGSRQPVWGFRDPHLSADSGSFASLEEMAAAYVRELVALRPEGPYALGGWSLGGTVAFEMACQLAEQGREVSFLLMLDTFRPTGSLKRLWYGAGRVARRRVLHAFGAGRLFSLLQGGGGRPLPPVARFLAFAYADFDCHDPRAIAASFPGLFDPADLARLSPAERWELVYRRLRAAGQMRDLPGMTAATLRREQRMFERHHALSDRYRPRRACSARITLFRVRGHDDPLGWQRYALHPIESHEFEVRGTKELPDPHLALMQDENVELYAGDLRGYLESLRGGEVFSAGRRSFERGDPSPEQGDPSPEQGDPSPE
ncbi:MAG TPA: non-ribosomal peptide synthetase [Thermoanaerobaculia bacterium]|nr:non-ribosomal peptide synthetase [Thermoanaerobaculia bacterium]